MTVLAIVGNAPYLAVRATEIPAEAKPQLLINATHALNGPGEETMAWAIRCGNVTDIVSELTRDFQAGRKTFLIERAPRTIARLAPSRLLTFPGGVGESPALRR